jgi:hypothetical protein
VRPDAVEFGDGELRKSGGRGRTVRHNDLFTLFCDFFSAHFRFSATLNLTILLISFSGNG